MNKKFIPYFKYEEYESILNKIRLVKSEFSSFNKLICSYFKSNHKTMSFRKFNE